MRRSHFHTALKILMLCIFTLTSTGFTALVKYCSMTQSSTCCCCNESSDKDAAPQAGASFTKSGASCFTQTVAGGLNAITATIGSDVVEHSVVLEVVAGESSAFLHSICIPSFLSTAANDTGPPGPDIYIRINSFLI